MYGSTGVCRVLQVGPLSFSSAQKDKLYYWLEPVYETGLIYAPVDGPAFIRPLMTRKEVDALIRKMPSLDGSEYSASSVRILPDRYRAALKAHQCETLLRMMKGAYLRAQQALKNGRRPGQMDVDYRKKAEKLLYGEFAVVLEIPYEEVPGYIEETLARQEEDTPAP